MTNTQDPTISEKAVNGWICKFCGTVYQSQKEAESCWDAHTELTIDYVWGGIGSSDMPKECVIKKHEGGYITKIATYELKTVDKVNIRERRKNGKK